MIFIIAFRKRHHAVKSSRAVGRLQLVVLIVSVVAKVCWLTQCAARLRKHLEAFAVESGFRRKRESQIEKHNLFQGHALPPAINKTRAAESAAPLTN